HHGAGGTAAELVPDAVDVEPFVGEALVDGHRLADAIDEDFAAAAGEAAHAGFLEPAQHLAEWQLVDLVEVPQLRRTESVEVHSGKVLLQIAEQLFVPFELEARMQAALHQDLVAAQVHGFLNLLVEYLARQHVGVGVGALAIEGAEVTDGGANVRVVDVAVD